MKEPYKQVVDLNELLDIVCPCGNGIFENIFILKKISALQSHTGKEEVIPISLMVCRSCGKSLEEIISPTMVQ